MAYDYLGLINDVNRRLNEVELTTSNFATATGEYGMIKDAVNASIRYINQHEYEWPFNHVTADETMTAGVVRYAFPTDAKTVDFDSFRIKRNDTLGNAYEYAYEYYRLPVDLINTTDVPTVPEQFRYIIVNGAMHFAYMFRGETQESQVTQARFMDEIKSMRSLYVNRYDYLRSTAITQNTSSVSSFRI